MAAHQLDPWVPEDSFGARLALVRQAMHWNVKEAAEACGLNDQSWRNWEDGKRCRDLVEVASKIHAQTGVDVTWIVMGGGSRTGSFSSLICALETSPGQGSLLDDDLLPLDFYSRAELASV